MITITIPRRGGPYIRFRDTQDVPTAAHIILHSPEKRILLLRRRGNDFGGHWGMPGGTIDPGESPLTALLRELREEIGLDLTQIPHAVNRVTELEVSQGSQAYGLGINEFTPLLNDEHDHFRWSHFNDLPDPMHPNARRVIRNYIDHFRGFIT